MEGENRGLGRLVDMRAERVTSSGDERKAYFLFRRLGSSELDGDVFAVSRHLERRQDWKR